MPEPKALADILAEVDALRGFGKPNARKTLETAWADVAGEAAAQSHPLQIRSGVLHVAVRNAGLLDELSNFRKVELLNALRERHSGLKVRDLRFKLARFRPAASEEDLGF